MGFHNGAKAKIWEVNDKGKYADVRLSISEKDKRTDEWVQAFQGFVRFIGGAHDKLPAEGAFVELLLTDVTNTYDKEKKTTYWNAKCFAWEEYKSDNNNSFVNIPDDIDDDEIPFE